MKAFKVAIIGFGAVAQQFHLPTLNANKNFEVTFIVDPSLSSASKSGLNLKQIPILADYHQVPLSEVDAMIVASPNHLHYPVAAYFLEHGKHVLIEKPVVLKPEQYQELQNKQSSKGILKSGMVKRHGKMAEQVKAIFQSQILGSFKSFEISEGMVFNWPINSLSFFYKTKAGGGVLIDNGIHTLDLLFWWMNQQGTLPQVTDFDYWDDSQGGIEAEAQALVQFQNGVNGSMHFSRMRPLDQKWYLAFEKGSLTIQNQRIKVNLPSKLQKNPTIKRLRQSLNDPIKNAFKSQLKTFNTQILEGQNEYDPVIPYTLDLVNRFYQNKQTLRTSYYCLTA